jgi:hypothetical protein
MEKEGTAQVDLHLMRRDTAHTAYFNNHGPSEESQIIKFAKLEPKTEDVWGTILTESIEDY